MKMIFERLRRHFPFLGERAVTELELFEFCDRGVVEVVFTPEIRRGVYVRHECGGDHIFLNSMLHGQSLVYARSRDRTLFAPRPGPGSRRDSIVRRRTLQHSND